MERHYHQRIYHPLVASCAETGDLRDAVLRPGAAHTAAGGLGFILEQVDRCRGSLCQRLMGRLDAGFPDPDTLSGLEARDVPYIARICNNQVLDWLAEPYLKAPRRSPAAGVLAVVPRAALPGRELEPITPGGAGGQSTIGDRNRVAKTIC